MILNPTTKMSEEVRETDPLWERFIDFIVSEFTGQYGIDRLTQNPPSLDRLPWADSRDEIKSVKVYSTSLTKTERKLIAMVEWSSREASRCGSKKMELIFHKMTEIFGELFWNLIQSRYPYPIGISIRADFSLVDTPEEEGSALGMAGMQKISGPAAELLVALLRGRPPEE